MGKLLTTKDVAAHFGVDSREVLYAARKGLIEGQKVGWQWLFHKDNLPGKWPVRTKSKRVMAVGQGRT